MTQGEKMVWAAAYALALQERLKSGTDLAMSDAARIRRPDLLQAELRRNNDYAASLAVLDATVAVERLREVPDRIKLNASNKNLIEMLNEMLGIIVEPPLRDPVS